MIITSEKLPFPRKLLIILACFVSLGRARTFGGRPKPLLCTNEDNLCNDSGFRHLEVNTTMHFDLRGAWTLELLKTSEGDKEQSEGANFSGYLSLTRTHKCQIKMSLQKMIFGSDTQRSSETVVVNLNENGGLQVCREPKLSKLWTTSRKEREDQLAGLAVNIVSAIANGRNESNSHPQTIMEMDNFGSCPTHYDMDRVSASELYVRRTRNLKSCGTTAQKFASESGRIFWASSPLDQFVENSEWACAQNYKNKVLNGVICSHDVVMASMSRFSSNLTARFLSSEEASNTDTSSFVDAFDFVETPKEGDEEEIQNSLQIICGNSAAALAPHLLSAFPRAISALNLLSREKITRLYRAIKAREFCPHNPYFAGIFDSLLRDAVSPAATSAKCQIILENDSPLNSGWVSSLVNSVSPTRETLRHCSDLLNLPSWSKSVLGVSGLAGVFRSSQCPSPAKDYDSCDLGEEFHSVTKSLWVKAGNCFNPDKESQNMALWAIRGLSTLDSAGAHVTEVLKSCVNTPKATQEVKIASLRALGKKMCQREITSWIQRLVLDEDQSSVLRMEAFKALYRCNFRVAEEFVTMVTQRNLELKCSQVTSFVESHSKFQNGTNFFKLSRHFELDLDEILGLKEMLKLEGDLIFDNSFLPRSLDLQIASSLIKRFGGAAQLELGQTNLEDILHPLIGSEGLKDSLQTVIQDVLFAFFDSLRNPSNETGDQEPQPQRRVKKEVSGNLRTLISAGLGDKRRFYSSYSFDPFFSNFDSDLEEYIDSIVMNLYSNLANYKMSSGVSWALRSDEAVAWSFFGPRLHMQQHEGLVATLKMSSQLSLFSLMKAPFNPSVVIKLNPNVGGYWHSSMEFIGNHKSAKAKLESPLHAGFDLHLKIKPTTEESVEIDVDLPTESTHGYSVLISKALISLEQNSDYRTDLPASQRKSEALGSLFSKSPVRVEKEYFECDEGFWKGLGLRSCFESSSWTEEEKTSVIHSKFDLAKIDDEINHFKILLSTKNPGQNSFFLSALLETEGGMERRRGNVVLGFNLSPHTTFRASVQAGSHAMSMEASIVNDWNLKRLEARTNVNGREHGIKAEVLMVRDGGQSHEMTHRTIGHMVIQPGDFQSAIGFSAGWRHLRAEASFSPSKAIVSIKPRLVVSRPTLMEDALLEGYLAHYSSDKVKSFTVDLVTQGTLKEMYDLGLKGTTEYRSTASGYWSLNLKNLHLISTGIDLGLETSLSLHENGATVDNQVTWDGDVIMMGAHFLWADATEVDAGHTLRLHFLSPNNPAWDTKISLNTQVTDGQLHNNLTIANGLEKNQWEFLAYHSTAWKIAYTYESTQKQQKNQWGGLWKKGRTIKVTDVFHINIPSEDVDIHLDHTFQVSDDSIENQVSLVNGGVGYSIMANFFDQSKEMFKYHMEIEVDCPGWRFSYVDTLLERGEGDIVGQSVATMPSGRIYTSSSRFKYENSLDLFHLGITYDTHVRGDIEDLKISFRQTLERSPEHVSFIVSLDTPDPVLGFEFSTEGLGSDLVYVFLKASVVDTLEAELSSRSGTGKTEASLALDLVPYSKSLQGKVSFGRGPSRGGAFEMEVEMSSPQHQSSSSPLLIAASSSLELKDTGTYIVKGDLSAMEWSWSAEMRTELGSKVSDPQKFAVRVTLPDKSRFEGESLLRLDFTPGEQNVECKTHIELPSGIVYKLFIDGKSQFDEGSLAQADLMVDINFPFTKEIALTTHFKNQIQDDQRHLAFYCDTRSEAQYWNELKIDFKWKQEMDKVVTTFGGKFGKKEVNLSFSGFYTVQNTTHSTMVEIEFLLPGDNRIEQLKVSTEAKLVTSSLPPGVEVSQVTSVEKNYVELFRSSGDLVINIPKLKGTLVISHVGTRFSNQEYKMQGKFNGEDIELSINGMVDSTPVRMSIHYTDGEILKVFSNYGGSSFASMGFISKLEGFSFGLRNVSSAVSKITTKGQINFRNRRTRFYHSLRLTPLLAIFNLRVNSLRGKPLLINYSRRKLSGHKWKTESSMDWGRVKIAFTDDVSFITSKDFDIKLSLNAPVYGHNNMLFHITSSHRDTNDQTLSVKYMEEDRIIHSGRFSIATSSLDSSPPYYLNAELVNIVIAQIPHRDFKLRQNLALPHAGIQIGSVLTRRGAPLVEIHLNVSEADWKLLFSVCSVESKCLRFSAQTQAHNRHVSIRNFDVELKLLNSLWGKLVDEDITQDTIALSAENEGGDVKLAAKLARSLCSDKLCMDSSIIGKHHLHLTTSTNNMDVLYENQNRILLLKTSFNHDYNQTMNENMSKVIKIQLWFDRLNQPDHVLIWTTSYQINDDLDDKSEQLVQSNLYHPRIERPVSLSGKLSTFANFKREVHIDVGIFEDPRNALQLHLLKNYQDGGYNLELNLKRNKENRPHFSLSTILIPSPDDGFFKLRFIAPKSMNKQGRSTNISFEYNCNMEVDRDFNQMLCQMNTMSVSEELHLFYGNAPEPCSGLRATSKIFDNSYKAYGAYCNSPFNMAAGVSLTDVDADEVMIRAGFADSNTFDVNLLNMAQANLTLFPPYLVQGSFKSLRTPNERILEFKETVMNEWRNLVRRTKATAAEVSDDMKQLADVWSDVAKPSQMREIANMFSHETRNILEEFSQDNFSKAIQSTIKASVQKSSELIGKGLSVLNTLTGDSLPSRSISSYGDKALEVASEIATNFLSSLELEMRGFQDYAENAVSMTTSWMQEVYDYAVHGSVISEPVERLSGKVKKILSLEVWPPLLHILDKTTHWTRQILSIFHSEINKEITEKSAILIPLLENFYDLESLLSSFTGIDSREYPTVSLPDEVRRWISLLLHPQELLEQALPPYNAQGVLVRNNLISLDGRSSSIDKSCPQLLLALEGTHGGTPVAIVSNNRRKGSERPSRELVFLVGNNTVRITRGNQVSLNGLSLNVPHWEDGLSIVRDVNQVRIAFTDSWGKKVVSLSCGLNHESCLIDVNGWFFANVHGLLGSFDYSPFNDYTITDWDISTHAQQIWQESWRSNKQCSGSGAELISMETEQDARSVDLCSRLFLDKNSVMVPCHSTVSVHPYYTVCLNSLQDLQLAFKRNQRSVNSNYNYSAQPNRDTNETIPQTLAWKRGENLGSLDSIGRKSRERLRVQSLDVKRHDKEALCDIAFAYSSACLLSKVSLDLPPECDSFSPKPRNDQVDQSVLSLDLLILWQEEDCISFLYDHVLRDIYQDLRDLLAETDIHHDIHVSAISYGSTQEGPLTFYGSGSSLLQPLEEVHRFQPQHPHTQGARGRLEEAFATALRFPFRKGTVRVLLVASCTDQDIPNISSAMTKDMKRRRVTVFSMTKEPLLHPQRSKDTFRNTIGIGSHHIYHLKRGAVHRKITKFIIPSSNLAHLSLGSNGGVFYVEEIKKEKRFTYYMQVFRKVLLKALLDSSLKIYENAKSRSRPNN